MMTFASTTLYFNINGENPSLISIIIVILHLDKSSIVVKCDGYYVVHEFRNLQNVKY